MKGLYAAVCRELAADGLELTPDQVRDNLRRRFLAALPALCAHGWPIPCTEEGKFVCLEILSRCRCRRT